MSYSGQFHIPPRYGCEISINMESGNIDICQDTPGVGVHTVSLHPEEARTLITLLKLAIRKRERLEQDRDAYGPSGE